MAVLSRDVPPERLYEIQIISEKETEKLEEIGTGDKQIRGQGKRFS